MACRTWELECGVCEAVSILSINAPWVESALHNVFCAFYLVLKISACFDFWKGKDATNPSSLCSALVVGFSFL